MTNKDLANLLFPNVTKTNEDYEKIYPERQLKEGAIVSRFAPSPTGRVHMGNLFASFVPEVFARQTDGVFILRIEDTDAKRAIENGMQPKTLQKILGHGSLQMTMDLYCHVTDDTLFEAMKLME